MLLFFWDESEHTVKRSKVCHIALGCVVIDAEQLSSFSKQFEKIKLDAGLPKGEEVKWSPDPGKQPSLHAMKEKDRQELYMGLLSLLSKYKMEVLVVVGKPPVRPSQNEKRETKRRNITDAVERIQMHLQQKRTTGLVFVDEESDNRSNKVLLGQVLKLQQDGTNFVLPELVAHPILITSSANSPALQFADLIVGVTRQMVGGYERYAKPLFNMIKPHFCKDRSGEVRGCGLKLHPRKLDLRYSILDK